MPPSDIAILRSGYLRRNFENTSSDAHPNSEIGVDVIHHQVVGDNHERMTEAFRLALSRSDVVISTGGLGPTEDDITRDAVAAALGVGQTRHPEIETFLQEKFDRIGRPMPSSNLVQADVPDTCRYILPDRGTAPGLACETADGVLLYAVPGVPAEMREMMSGTILPELRARTGEARIAFADGCVVTAPAGTMVTVGKASPCAGGQGLVTSGDAAALSIPGVAKWDMGAYFAAAGVVVLAGGLVAALTYKDTPESP